MLTLTLTLPLLSLLLPSIHAQSTTSTLTTSLLIPSPFLIPSPASASLIAANPTGTIYFLSGANNLALTITSAVNLPTTTIDIVSSASATRINPTTTAAGANPNNIGLSDGGSTSLHCLLSGSPTATAGTCTTLISDGNVAGAVGVVSAAMDDVQLHAWAPVSVTGGLEKLAEASTATAAPLSLSSTGVSLNPAGGGVVTSQSTTGTGSAPLSQTSTGVTLNPAGGGVVTSQTATTNRAGPGTGSSASSVFGSASAGASSESAAATASGSVSQGTTRTVSSAATTSYAPNSVSIITATPTTSRNGAVGWGRGGEGWMAWGVGVGVAVGVLLV